MKEETHVAQTSVKHVSLHRAQRRTAHKLSNCLFYLSVVFCELSIGNKKNLIQVLRQLKLYCVFSKFNSIGYIHHRRGLKNR